MLSTCERMKLNTCLLSCTKINSKWIKDLNIRYETLKLLDGNIGGTLEDIDIGKDVIKSTGNNQQSEETAYRKREKILLTICLSFFVNLRQPKLS